MSWQRLDEHCRNLHALDHALSILGADEATHMPSGGGEARAASVSLLAGMYHEQASAPHIAEWIAAARREELTPQQQVALTEFERVYRNLTCLPSDFVKRQTAVNMRSEQAWRKLRAANDWEGFRPLLEENVVLMREEAAMRADALGVQPYDALMEQFDPGNRAAAITPAFDALKAFLRDFLPAAMETQQRRRAQNPLKPFSPPFPVEKQSALGLAAIKAIGFDMEHGRIDVSHHPFCGGVPDDIRMTTRYRADDFITAFMATLHETGHALYEQGLPRELAHWPSAKARGMGMHESQSMFVELQIARSAEFWEWALPLVNEHLGGLDNWSPDDMLAHINTVEPGLIRVDADEVTYPLHIILRYELEQALVSGQLQVRDLPEAWDTRMQDYLGLSTISDPANGPMQDVHWPAGMFGYFPSYALGAMMAAQEWAAMEKAVPDARQALRRGDFEPLNAWRRENIWHAAATAPTPDILEKATGEPLNADYFTAHLRKRYLG